MKIRTWPHIIAFAVLVTVLAVNAASLMIAIFDPNGLTSKDYSMAWTYGSAVAIPTLGYVAYLLKKTNELSEELRYMATHDMLTLIPNRAYFNELACQKDLSSYFVIMLDIDHFKRVNDTYGHTMGDVVIKGVAQILSTHVSADDLVARFGGEEYIMLYKAPNMAGAHRFAEKLRLGVAKAEFVEAEHSCSVTISAGIAPVAGEHPLEQAIKYADFALYEAKNSGRNKVAIRDSTQTWQVSAS